MASPLPENTPPLHNFSLPSLWSTHHRARRNRTSSPPTLRRRNSSEFESENPRRSPANQTVQKRSSADQTVQKRRLPECSTSRPSPLRRPDSSSEPESDNQTRSQADQKVHKRSTADQMIQKRPSTSQSDGGVDRKICIKIRNMQIRKTSPDHAREEKKAPPKADERVEERGEAEETLAKTWNFRPRRPNCKKLSNNNSGQKDFPDTKLRLQAPEANVDSEEREKKLKFSIPLSKMEIEEDIYAMTKSKPARKPKKRSKTIQKQLDNIFPGLWLSSITPDLYKVDEAPPKA